MDHQGVDEKKDGEPINIEIAQVTFAFSNAEIIFLL